MDYFAAVVFVLWTASVVYTFVGMRRTAKLHFLALLHLKDSTTTYSTICQCIFHYNMPIDDFVYIISDFRMFYTILPFFGKVVFRLERFVAKQKLRSRLQSALQSPFRATFKEATFRHRRESSERALERAVFFFPG